MTSLNYTTIHHKTRKSLNLSPYDYMVADIIYNLQNNQTSKNPGWCYASKTKIGDMLGMTERGVTKVIGRLMKLGLLEKDETTKDLRASQEWYEKVVFINENQETRNTVPSDTEHRSAKTRNTVLPKPGYDNNIDNNNDNSLEREGKPSGTIGEKETIAPPKLSHTIGYLSAIPEEDINHWIGKFPVLSREIIIREAGKAKAWIEANGKKKKDYQAFMRNWLDNTAERLEKQKGGSYATRVFIAE